MNANVIYTLCGDICNASFEMVDRTRLAQQLENRRLKLDDAHFLKLVVIH